jgi:hypothetical protein|tara:strand:+ start:1146 stop:2264 length:1119 start_codon:yes stop_codon:yes gene_type:complete
MPIKISRDIAGAEGTATVPDDVLVDAVVTDGATGDKETTFQHSDFAQNYGYYTAIPELKQAIDMRAMWTVGKGWKADVRTTVVLERMRGWGEDTFNDILKNMIVVRRVCGDAFAEIIKDNKGNLLNIKPLDPSTIKTIVDRRGMLVAYAQTSKTSTRTKKRFQPEQILHFMNKRRADEIHGRSDIDVIEEIIKANHESFQDMKQLMHRHVKPIMAFKLATDNPEKIAAFITKMDAIINQGKNIYIPKDTVEFELVAVPSNATLNPLPWRNHLKDYFFQVVGIPQIILGSSGEFTESTAKIAYLAFQQSVEDEQREIQDQIWRQLRIRLELEFPATMQNEVISMKQDEAKDAGQATGFQPSDTQIPEVGVENG